LALLSLFALFAFLSPYFLLFLPFLLCLAPIPSVPRKNKEMRGYGMSLKVEQWRGDSIGNLTWLVAHSANNFVNSNYWYMYPFRNTVEGELTSWLIDDDRCLGDKNVAYTEVHRLVQMQ
jgi:hypothetical protein